MCKLVKCGVTTGSCTKDYANRCYEMLSDVPWRVNNEVVVETVRCISNSELNWRQQTVVCTESCTSKLLMYQIPVFMTYTSAMAIKEAVKGKKSQT